MYLPHTQTHTLLRRVALLLVAILYGGIYMQAQVQHIENRVFAFADSINQFIKAQKEGTPRLSESMVTLYLRHNMFTQRCGPIVRYLPNMPRLERGRNEYVTEAQLMLQMRPPGEIDCKVIAYHSTNRYLQPERFTSYSRFNFQIYDAKLFIDQLLNPFNRRNSRFYHYCYVFTHLGNGTTATTVRMHIQPRFSNDQLTKGYADVDIKTGAITHFILQFNIQLQHITVNARMGRNGLEQLTPQRMRIVSNFKLLGNKVLETTDLFAHYSFSCPLPHHTEHRDKYDLTQQCWLRIDTTQMITSASYFDAIRPMALRESEKQQFKQHNAPNENDSTFNLPNDPTLADPKVAHQHNTLGKHTQNILLSSHALNLSNDGYAQLKLPAIITPSMLQWSGAKGLSLRTRIKFTLNKNPNISDDVIQFSPVVGYSFKQKQVYWQVPLNLRFWPKKNALLTFEVGGGARSYNNKQAEELRQRLKGMENFDSINNIINHYGFNDYRDNYALCNFTFSPLPGLNITLGSRYHHRVLVDWNNITATMGLSHHLSSLAPSIQIEWTPAQYYYRNNNRCIPLYSHYPTFIAQYERGFGLNRNATYYERIEGDVRYRLPLYALRTLYFRAGIGCYTQRGNNCFIDYDFLRFNYVPQGWTDELTGEFQLLSARWYNESRYYVRCTSTYESPMLALSRIPFISRIVQTERIYFNMLSVHALGFYAEAGYGFSTHLMDIGVFTGMSHDHVFNFGCKIALKSL